MQSSSHTLLRVMTQTTRRHLTTPSSPKSVLYNHNQNVLKNTLYRSMSTLIKPWPTPMIESNGDYRSEAHLETHIGGPLYDIQSKMPRLPIPPVEETIKKFLPTALPLAETLQEHQSLLQCCKDFPKQAAELQTLLEQRRNTEMKDSSWLQLWWNTMGYLQVRDPVVINVSYFFHFADDGTLTKTNPQINRAAAMLTAASEFRNQVCSGTLPPETVGKKDKMKPVCSTMYKYMFHACRIPRRDQDSYRIYDPSLHKHCIVAYHGQFFAVDFMDSDGNALPLEVLEARLQKCVEIATRREQEGTVPPHFGWCTGSNRDSWADAREAILSAAGPKAEQALEKLESGALMICLDDENPISRNQCGSLFLHGNLTSSYNRWFDKSIQLSIAKNGKMGFIGEHSMMDGMPLVNFANYISKVTYGDVKEKTAQSSGSNDGGVQEIFEDCIDLLKNSDDVNKAVEKAKDDFTTLVTSHELNALTFHGYGSNYIKSIGYSPDAYIQMAMQLATYRLFHKQGGTYEATQVRTFLHGRTETTRSVSPASNAFCMEMGLVPKQDEVEQDKRRKKIDLLKQAVNSHVQYIGQAANAFGVDRHLLGLNLIAYENPSVKTPDLFSHPLYARSKHWRVSTSHLTHPKFMNWGYGEVVPDGVGLSYMMKPNSCTFNVTARKENGYVDTLGYLLEEALLEMQTLHDLEKGMVSKL